VLTREDQQKNLILDTPGENLTEYYQWLIKKKYGGWLKLQSPLFGTHITVIRPQEVNGENPVGLKYENKQLTVRYNPGQLERHWDFGL